MVLLPEPDTPITISAQGSSPGLSGTKILRPGCFVDKPYRLACAGMRPVRWQVLACEHARQDRALFSTRYLEQHFPATAECRQGQRHARDKRLDMRLRHADHPALGLAYRRKAGKQ